MRHGRGLEPMFPDIIPLERPDVLDDLKQFVDVHRLTDFTLHDRVVPTIVLKRLEDEMIIAFQISQIAVAANFGFIQLWNGTLDKILRPVAILCYSGGGDPVYAFDNAQIAGASVIGTPVDRRRVGGPFTINAGTIGSFRSGSGLAQVGLGSIWQAPIQQAKAPPELLATMALPPGTGLDFNTNVVNVSLVLSIAYKVEPINKTRTGGL